MKDPWKPSEQAIAAAEAAARKSGNRQAQIRHVFVRSHGSSPPPMAHILRGGRASAVRLKVYLSLLWILANPPHDTTTTSAGDWATLLDLEDPRGRGTRRINSAITWLAKEGFLEKELRPGRAPRVILKSEAGDGSSYSVPGSEAAREQEPSARRYLNLPPSLWRQGWFACLSAPALCCMLMLISEASNKQKGEWVWIAPSVLKSQYGLSEDSRTRGMKQLLDGGIVVVRSETVGGYFEERRRRHKYQLRLDVLDTPCWVR